MPADQQVQPSEKDRTLWFCNFPTGRFANAIFQFLFAEYVASRLGANVILGGLRAMHDPTIFQALDLPDETERCSRLRQNLPPNILTLGVDRARGPDADVQLIEDLFLTTNSQILAIDGYFQYDTHYIARDEHYLSVFDKYIALNSNHTTFQKVCKIIATQLSNLFRTTYLICIHLRRGDYVDNVSSPAFFTTDVALAMEEIREITTYNRISNFTIFVATDDSQWVRSVFNKVKLPVLTSADLQGLPALASSPPMDPLLFDIAAMASCDLFVASNSSLSILGALMNTRANVFLRPTSSGGRLIPFDPWHTQVLFKA
jgi:hypothetical protein